MVSELQDLKISLANVSAARTLLFVMLPEFIGQVCEGYFSLDWLFFLVQIHPIVFVLSFFSSS